MIVKNVLDVKREPVIAKGVDKVTKQVLLGPDDGAPNFTMRRFIVEPGGFTFYHTHDFEHEVYILAGEGIARAKDVELKIKKDMAILVIPNEVHQFINNGNEDLVFLCIIPN